MFGEPIYNELREPSAQRYRSQIIIVSRALYEQGD